MVNIRSIAGNGNTKTILHEHDQLRGSLTLSLTPQATRSFKP